MAKFPPCIRCGRPINKYNSLCHICMLEDKAKAEAEKEKE
ncbi:hypothetical protein SEA_SHAGRAT_104 [Rhodococcus phage Shagrat]|nr:hypothetical protein SEA_SHAGRAT_104 [Rhodococcus phage Shagrat]